MSPLAGESTAKFVMRVEAVRKSRNLKATEVFHVFSRKLPLAYQRQIDALRPSLRVSARRAPNWSDVVGIAKDEITGALLTSPDEAGQAASAPAATPESVVPPVSAPATTTPPSIPKVTDNRPVCDLCQRLGAGGHYHKRDYCFIDPGSKAYKPDVRAKRLQDA